MDFTSLIHPSAAPVAPEHVGSFGLVELVDADARAQAVAEARRQGGLVAKMNDTPSNLGSGLRDAYIVYKPQPDYKVGDIVSVPSMRGRRKSTVHPVTAIRGDAVYTKGTSNRNGDGWTDNKAVWGKITKAFRQK